MLMEEGKAGYVSESSVHYEGREAIGVALAEGLDVHDIESISDVSISDIDISSSDMSSITESEGEESDAPTPSLTPIAFNHVPKIPLQTPSASRLPAGILRGAGAGTGIRRERSVQFRNSPEVRYIK
jgi:hypothetical protein